MGAFVLDPRIRAIMAMAREAPGGPLPDALVMRTHDPVLVTSAHTLATLLGIVFLMTTKPELVTDILVMWIALLLGLVVSLPFWMARWWRAGQPGEGRHNTQTDPFRKQNRLYEAMVE